MGNISIIIVIADQKYLKNKDFSSNFFKILLALSFL